MIDPLRNQRGGMGIKTALILAFFGAASVAGIQFFNANLDLGAFENDYMQTLRRSNKMSDTEIVAEITASVDKHNIELLDEVRVEHGEKEIKVHLKYQKVVNLFVYQYLWKFESVLSESDARANMP